ncbi:hypothetical protein ACWGI8_26425 [Streptomyces sp. NPDC054841]
MGVGRCRVTKRMPFGSGQPQTGHGPSCFSPAPAQPAPGWPGRSTTPTRPAEARGWGRNIRFAVNRGLVHLLTGYVEVDVIRHTDLFTPLRALDLPVGHIVTVVEEMGIFEDDSKPSFERWLAQRLEELSPGIRSEAERWTRVLHKGGPRSVPRREGTVWLYLNRIRPALLESSDRYDHLREVTRSE